MKIPKAKDIKSYSIGTKFNKSFIKKVEKLFECAAVPLRDYGVAKLDPEDIDLAGLDTDDCDEIAEYIRQSGYIVESGIYPTTTSTYGMAYAEWRLIISIEPLLPPVLAY